MKPAPWPTFLGSPDTRDSRSSPEQSPESRKDFKHYQPNISPFLNRSPIESELGHSPSQQEQVKSMHTPAGAPPERPLSRQQFGGPPAQVEQQVLAQTLRNENELLRMQLREVSLQERQHRAELARLREQRDSEVGRLVQEQTAGYVHEIEQLGRALEGTEAELRREVGERERLVRALEEQSHSAAQSDSRAVAQVRSLEAVVGQSAALVAEMASGVEAFQQHVLPTFKVPPEARAGNEERAPLEGDRHGLGKQLHRLERALALLRMMVDAKSDTLVLIRGKLKAEKQALEAEVSRLLGQAQQGHVAQRDKEHSLEEERGQLRQEMHALQDLYSAELQQLQTRLAEYERGEAGESTAVAAVQRELRATSERLAALEGANRRLSATLEEESGLRAQVVAQLAAQRKETAATRSELETLKLSQKFLVRQPRGGARIPAEKMDLMNMVNHLLHEVGKLKSEKVAVEEELKAMRHAQVHARAQGAFTQRDVALAAADRVRDSEIAMKLVRQRLQQGGGNDYQESWTGNREPSPGEEEEGTRQAEVRAREEVEWGSGRRQDGNGISSPPERDATLSSPRYHIAPSASSHPARRDNSVAASPYFGGSVERGYAVPTSTPGSESVPCNNGAAFVYRYHYQGSSIEPRVLSPRLPEKDKSVN